MNDRLIFTPADVDLSRSPLARDLGGRTYVLGAFNPGLTRLPSGNLLMMVRVAEALREPLHGGFVHAIRWRDGCYGIDAWPKDTVDASDPRVIVVPDPSWKVLALTSMSWLLPVELDADADAVVAVHYDRAIASTRANQCYGIEDARLSRAGGRWLMTACTVSPERQGTTLFASDDALDWRCEGLVLDHQNKDMLIFEGLIGDRYWAQTRPLGQAFFAYPPGGPHRAGPSINLANSPDGLHWRPHDAPGLRPSKRSVWTRMGGGTPPILTRDGWLTLWHAVEPNGGPVGGYRTWWSILDEDDPSMVVRQGREPLLIPNPALTAPLAEAMYVDDVVFTTGIVDAGDHFVVASGEADLACRITRVPKTAFGL